MKLISAAGSPRMQKALSHLYVRTIVKILLSHEALLKDVASILKTYERRAQPGFMEDLEALYADPRYLDAAATLTIPDYVSQLVETLRSMYRQSREDITYQRGAIVELLACELVRPRYKPGECVSNHRFIDGKYTSDQIDVAVLSQPLHQIEGYECKLKVESIENSNCTNLSCLVEVAEEQGYQTSVGIITFNDSTRMSRHLRRFQPALCIHLYGVDNLSKLKVAP